MSWYPSISRFIARFVFNWNGQPYSAIIKISVMASVTGFCGSCSKLGPLWYKIHLGLSKTLSNFLIGGNSKILFLSSQLLKFLQCLKTVQSYSLPLYLYVCFTWSEIRSAHCSRANLLRWPWKRVTCGMLLLTTAKCQQCDVRSTDSWGSRWREEVPFVTVGYFSLIDNSHAMYNSSFRFVCILVSEFPCSDL